MAWGKALPSFDSQRNKVGTTEERMAEEKGLLACHLELKGNDQEIS